MRIAVAVAALSAATYVLAVDPAPVISGNPLDVIYTATLPKKPFFTAPELDGNIKGFISGSAPPDGVGVRFTVRFENLPKTGGPFRKYTMREIQRNNGYAYVTYSVLTKHLVYHIHANKATGGNCTSAGAHLDPMNRGEKPPCDPSQPATCQVGDLSGKYGRINSDPFVAEYVDIFASLKEGDPAFFGNRSFVIHLANVTRITCANFADIEPSFPNATSTENCSTPTQSGIEVSSTASLTGIVTPTTDVNSGSSPSNIVVPSPTVVIAAGTRTLPGLLLWCFVGMLWMVFSH